VKEYTHESNDLCFKNEEVVALVALLLSVGVVTKKMISSPDYVGISPLIRRAIQKLDYGGWISELELLSGQIIQGELLWDAAALTKHCESVISNMNENRPVLCSEFRRCESVQLRELILRQAGAVFNFPLLNVIKAAVPLTLLFVTDRPALSLGFTPSILSEDLGGGTFWTALKQSLFEDNVFG
jgi:hypothetical protein